MTKQEIFNKVVTHLRAQGKQSLSHEGKCMYRGMDGCMCAAGVLINDDHYSEDLEYHNTLSNSVKEALENSGILMDRNTGNTKLVFDLQNLHDGRSFSHTNLDFITNYPAKEKGTLLMDHWEGGFHYIAESHGLEMPV